MKIDGKTHARRSLHSPGSEHTFVHYRCLSLDALRSRCMIERFRRKPAQQRFAAARTGNLGCYANPLGKRLYVNELLRS